jgi:hypothetical protein
MQHVERLTGPSLAILLRDNPLALFLPYQPAIGVICVAMANPEFL